MYSYLAATIVEAAATKYFHHRRKLRWAVRPGRRACHIYGRPGPWLGTLISGTGGCILLDTDGGSGQAALTMGQGNTVAFGGAEMTPFHTTSPISLKYSLEY